MARKRERIIAGGAAILFLITTLAATVGFVWQLSRGDDRTQSIADQLGQQEERVYGPLANFEPVENVEKLQKIELKEGGGQEVKPNDTVTVKYTGAYASDGQIFDSSELNGGEPITFGLNQVISGWGEGVPGLKVGGKRRILIPAEQAYGANAPPGIRANADMVFDIELIAIEQQ